MDLRKLGHFLAVAEAGSMTGGAFRLRMAQPALTQSIARLEKELKIRLFLRSRRGVELTEAGSFLFGEARDLLARADAVARAAERHADGTTGAITVGFVSTALYRILPHAIADLKRFSPEARIRIREMRTNDQIEALRIGEIDVGICHAAVRGESWLRQRTIAEYGLCAALPEADPPTARGAITLAALAARGLVLFPEGEGPPDRTQIVEAFRQAGCEPRIVQEASPTLAVLACVAAGLGASLLPDCVGFIGMTGVRMCDIERPNGLPKVGLALIRRIHPRRKLVDRFWQACLDQAPVAG
jgi:DNA-binding transcriptional LysR family regulator